MYVHVYARSADLVHTRTVKAKKHNTLVPSPLCRDKWRDCCMGTRLLNSVPSAQSLCHGSAVPSREGREKGLACQTSVNEACICDFLYDDFYHSINKINDHYLTKHWKKWPGFGLTSLTDPQAGGLGLHCVYYFILHRDRTLCTLTDVWPFV